jgi:hypothetical protein
LLFGARLESALDGFVQLGGVAQIGLAQATDLAPEEGARWGLSADQQQND